MRLEHLAWEGLPDFVLGEDADAVAAARDVGAARRAVRHCREAEEALNDVEDAPNAALQALEKAEKADEAEGTLKRPRDDDDAAAGASRPKTETGATVSPYISLHDVTDDLPRLGAVLPAWHPLATTSRVPRAKKVVVELVDA